ncbi:hypothetical protein Tco_0318218 [Tanacetum coccineum]
MKNTVISSNEASSGVTYTSISSNYEEPSDAGSTRVVVYRYDGLPMHLVDPPSPDYVPGPEQPEQALLSPNYVPGPEYPEYLALSDHEIPIEDQLYAAAASPIVLSPTNGGDGDDDDDSSVDDANDEEEASDEDEEEEEEYLAPADSTDVSSTVDPVPSAEETEPFETDESAATPPPAYRTTARMAAGIQMRAASPLPSPTLPPTHHPLPLPTPSTSRRANILEADIPPRKRLCLTAPTSRFEVWESSTATAARQPGLGAAHTTDYGFFDMWMPFRREEEVNARVTELAETHKQDTQDLYAHLEDAQDSRARLAGRVDILPEDRQFHQQTIMLIEDEAREALTATLVAQVSSLQTQLIAALGQIYALQARDPTHADDPKDADSSSMTKMASRRGTRTRTTPATATATTPMTDATIRAFIA